MTPSEFTIALLQTLLSWPVAAIIAAWMFKGELAALIERLNEFKIGNSQAKFTEALKSAADTVKNEPILGDPPPPDPASTPTDKLTALLNIDPNAAIIAAWVDLEAAGRDALIGEGRITSGLGIGNPLNLVRELHRNNLITEEDYGFLELVRRIRNNAAHKPGAAIDYIAAKKTIDALVILTRKLRNEKGRG